MNATTSVHVERLGKRFGDFVAVDAISFDIRAGEIWGFLGPNGSGKSTTIRMLCGVLEPSSGTADVLGFDVARDPEAVKLRIGYMSQGSTLWADLTVQEHLRFYAGLYGMQGSDREERIAEWMQRVGLGERRAQLAGALPGGYRKRLALACTLLHSPQMIFLDEPTAGVDPVSRREFWDIIVGLADEGTTVMVTTHYLDEAEHCNQLAMIYNGKIVARGSPEELKHLPQIGTTVEVLSNDTVAVIDAIEHLPFVRGAGLYGSSLHISLSDAGEIESLNAAIAARGLSAGAAHSVLPSLEDVFSAVVKPQ